MIYEWQWCDATDAGWSRENDNIVNVVRPYYIHTLYMRSQRVSLFKKVPTQENIQLNVMHIQQKCIKLINQQLH